MTQSKNDADRKMVKRIKIKTAQQIYFEKKCFAL